MTYENKNIILNMTDEQLKNIYRFRVKTEQLSMDYFVDKEHEAWKFFMETLESRCGIPEDLELKECYEEPLNVQKERKEREERLAMKEEAKAHRIIT